MNRIQRELEIENKIFTKADIRNFWNLFFNEYQTSLNGQKNADIEITLTFDDKTTYRSYTDDLLGNGGSIDTKKTRSIEIEFYEYGNTGIRGYNKYVRLRLTHGEYSNKIEISGSDESWVSKIFQRTHDLVNGATNQEAWIREHENKLFILITILCGSFFISCLNLFFDNFIHIQPTQEMKAITQKIKPILINMEAPLVILGLLNRYLSGLWISMPLYSYIKKQYPSVEFDFGPEHRKKEKLTRKWIYSILGSLIIAGIYDLIKSLFLR
jgi:hypothetical protein